MKYTDLLLSSNTKTANIIFKAIPYFDKLNKMKLYMQNKNDNFKKAKMNRNDVVILSLFLSFLSSRNNVSKILKKYDVAYSKIIKTVGLNKIEVNKDLPEEEYIRIYNKYFKKVIDKFLYLAINDEYSSNFENFSINTLYSYVAEYNSSQSNVVSNLMISAGINSSIIDDIYYEIVDLDYDEDDYEEDKKEGSTLRSNSLTDMFYGRKNYNLTDLGDFLTNKDYIVDPAFNREEEINALMCALATPKMSAIIIGNHGVGKTALVHGLAYRIKNNNVPSYFKDYKIFRSSITSIMSGTRYRGELEDKFLNLINEVKATGKTILFLDEFHNVMGGGTEDQSNNLADMIKPHIEDGTLKIIGATTIAEYDKFLSHDPALKRRLECIRLNEQENSIISSILINTIPEYEKSSNITFGLVGNELIATIDFIVEATSKRYRVYNDMQYNPALALSILARAFGIAMVEGSQTVTKTHIAKAILNCQRLGKDARTRKSIELENEINTIDKIEDNGYAKVINIHNHIKDRHL